MQREVNFNEISDGRKYRADDLAKADCGGCQNCSSCCRGMGNSIILDPFDMENMKTATGLSAQDLLSSALELHVVDHLILPNLKMTTEHECCSFLDEKGRCRIHAYRPGFCRMFPLGRIYENGTFYYFLQTQECKKEKRTKIKIKKWIGIPDIRQYESFICEWHYLLKDLGEHIAAKQDDSYQKQTSLFLLKNFYLTPYEDDDFYSDCSKRISATRRMFHL